jgi:hypothetical protein
MAEFSSTIAGGSKEAATSGAGFVGIDSWPRRGITYRNATGVITRKNLLTPRERKAGFLDCGTPQ